MWNLMEAERAALSYSCANTTKKPICRKIEGEQRAPPGLKELSECLLCPASSQRDCCALLKAFQLSAKRVIFLIAATLT